MSATLQLHRVSNPPREAIAALALKQRVLPARNLMPLIAAGFLRFTSDDDDNWAWVVNDRGGRVSISHYLLGTPFEPFITGDESWPIGIAGIPPGNSIAVVRGAKDFIAAPRVWNDGTAVVAMVADAPISEEALHLFAGRDVAMADCDRATRKPFDTWRRQLQGIARRVTRFVGVEGYCFRDGRPALSIADLARIEWEQLVNRGKGVVHAR